MTVRVIGRHSYIGSGGEITTPVTIGNFTSIAHEVRMHERLNHPCVDNPCLVASGTARIIPGYPEASERAGIDIGSDVWIGRNAVLLGGITIGHGANVGAFSVVAKDVPPYAVVVGNPCQILRYRFDPHTISDLLTLAWWEWSDEMIAERASDLRDVGVFLGKYGYDMRGRAD